MKAQEATRLGGITWLVLAYRLPANSGLKTTIRRQLTAIGAVYPSNAVATLPASPVAERAFRRLRHVIGEAGGSAQVLRAEAIEGEPNLVAAFNAAREHEYREIVTGCGDFVAGIENMTADGHFRYSDLGEKDAELKRLAMRDDAIRMRDSLGAANAGSALSSLARCRVVLDVFAGRVYQEDAASITGNIPGPARSSDALRKQRRRGSPITRKGRQRSLPDWRRLCGNGRALRGGLLPA